MKKGLLLLISPILLASMPVVSTEISFALSPERYYQLHQTSYTQDFDAIPSNPNVFEPVDTYLDKELTEVSGQLKPNQNFTIQSVEVNHQHQLVFQLEDGTYIPANKEVVYDDAVLETIPVDQTMWLTDRVEFVSSPIGNQATPKHSSKQAYQPVQVTEITRTPLAVFAKVEGQGFIRQEYLTQTDRRMEHVQDLLDKKYKNSHLSIYVKSLSSEEIAGVNQTIKRYSASIAKLPLLYYVQEEITAGNIKWTDYLYYVKDVSSFKGSYLPEGSGSISKEADQLPYQVEDLIDKIAKESDNVASNILAYYVAHQFDRDYYQTIDKVLEEKWDMANREASAEMAGQMMESLYYQNGRALQSLQSTQFDHQRIARDLPVPVAHKIGDADDFRHDVAVVYASEPYILSIFTEKEDYELISQISNDIYGILK